LWYTVPYPLREGAKLNELNREQTRALKKLFTKVKFDTIGFDKVESGNMVVALGNASGRVCIEMKESGQTARAWKE
jgi:hypothetical protein